MPNELGTTHITPAKLIDYFDRDLTEDEEERIELHLAGCQECASRARHASALCDTWQRWTATSHGEAFLRSAIQDSLGSAASEESLDENWKKRIDRWRRASSGLAEGAVRVIAGAVKNTSQILTEGMEVLLRPGAAWRFTQQPGPVPVRGMAGSKKAPASSALAECPGGGFVRVKIDDHDDMTRKIAVSIDRFPRGRIAPIVILVSLSRGRKEMPKLTQMRRQGEGLIALFRGLSAGEYLVVFEPLSSQNAS